MSKRRTGNPADNKDTVFNAGISGVTAGSGVQLEMLDQVIDAYPTYMNNYALSSSGLPVKTPSAQYKGFASEAHHSYTSKINALSLGVPDYKYGAYTKGKMPDGSTLSAIDQHTDIVVFTRNSFIDKPRSTANNCYQLKCHDKQSAYKSDLKNPKYKDVNFVGGAGQGVNDRLHTKVGWSNVESDPNTPNDLYVLAENMKSGKTPPYPKRAEKQRQLNNVNLRNSIVTGAAISAVYTGTTEIIDLIKNRDNLSKEDFVNSTKRVLLSSLDGAARGCAIEGALQITSGIAGKNITNSCESVPVMAAANVTVSLCEDIYRCFVEKSIDKDDVLCNTVNNAYSSVLTFGAGKLGGALAGSITPAITAGAAIGSPLGPVGIILGSVIFSFIGGIFADTVINTANKDAERRFADSLSLINSCFEEKNTNYNYYIDNIAQLSEYKWTFKNLLPGYGLISDLREYNLRSKALTEIQNIIHAKSRRLDKEYTEHLRSIEKQHITRMNALKRSYQNARKELYGEFRDGIENMLITSCNQYLPVLDIVNKDVDQLLETLDTNIYEHDKKLERLKRDNKSLHSMVRTLSSIVSLDDKDGHDDSVSDILDQIINVLHGNRYISFDEALLFVKG